MSVLTWWQRLRHMDVLLLLCLFFLACMGIAAIYSVALSQTGSDFLFVKKQLIALAIGWGVIILLSTTNYRLLRYYGWTIYISSLSLLIAVLLIGKTINGTTGWFLLGPLSFQPVEFAKIAVIVPMARLLSDRVKTRLVDYKTLLISLLFIVPPVALLLAQPDLGSALVLIGIWFVLLLFGGIAKRDLVIGALTAGMCCLVAWNFFLVDYQKERILTFINPTADALTSGYHVNQALIAIGSGQWMGSGLGFGSQSQLKFLPESQTDFLFAVIAEELGFFGVCLLLLLFTGLFYRIWRLAYFSDDRFTSYLLMGIATSLFLPFMVNIGMNIGLLPVTGLGLPFVSYGGSAFVFACTLIGVVQSIAIEQSLTHASSRLSTRRKS